MKHRKPRTPAETLRFRGGIWQEIHLMDWSLGTFRQVTARSADAMTDYEEALGKIAKGNGASAKIASEVLKKYRFQ